MRKIEAGYCTTKLVYSCFDSLSEVPLTMLLFFPVQMNRLTNSSSLYDPDVLRGSKYSILNYLSVTAECLLSPWPFTPWGQQSPCGCCHFSAWYWQQSRRGKTVLERLEEGDGGGQVSEGRKKEFLTCPSLWFLISVSFDVPQRPCMHV